MESHNERVTSISTQVLSFYEQSKKFRIYHGSTNSTRRTKWRRNQVVDTSDLTHVLEVDVERNIVIVEPNVPMDKLVEATLKHGLVPPVVPEFPGITVGGAVVGTAGESSSYKYGFVDSNVEKIQIVLANGDVKFASRSENADLFYGVASSFGTLGVLVLVEMRLILAKKYVALTYHRTSSHAEAIKGILGATEDPAIDFIDGILFSKSKGAIIIGRFTDDESTGPVRRFTRRRDQWFYIHARNCISKKHSQPVTDLVPLVDYLFRYDRGAFFTGRYAYKYFLTPFDRFTRFLLDYFMHTRVLYHALHESGMSNYYIIQDLALPKHKTEDFLNYVDKELDIYPLWICPLQPDSTGIMNPYYKEGSGVMINIGVWGPGPSNHKAFVGANRDLERTVRDLGGVKWLYAQTYYSEDEFWSIYDREAYDKLREKYGACGLPNVYEKVRSEWEEERRMREDAGFAKKLKIRAKDVWPLRGFYGIARTVLGMNYLLDRK